MGNKNQFKVVLGPNAPVGHTGDQGISWQTDSPVDTLFPLNVNTQSQGSVPSGILDGSMSSTNVIYSQIIDISRIDNGGIEMNFNVNDGDDASGTLEVQCSVSGINFYAITFNPLLRQPSGTPDGYLINLNQLPFKYVMLVYTNSSGSGTMTAYLQLKDIN